MTLDHVGIATDDTTELADFYEDLVGYEVVHEEEFGELQVGFVDTGHADLEPKSVIELFSHRDDRTSRIVSAFVVGDSDDKAKAQGKKHLCSCVDAASGERTPEAAVLH
ncbi:hypothetical protein JCM31271_31680 [Halorubrum trueperi]